MLLAAVAAFQNTWQRSNMASLGRHRSDPLEVVKRLDS